MSTLKNNLAQVKAELKIYICEKHEELLITAAGRNFSLYGFEFFGLGADKHPNALLQNGKGYQDLLGEGNIAFARDGSGGYFFLKNDNSKSVGFKNQSEEYEYAVDIERFINGFLLLDKAIVDYVEVQTKDNPEFDLYEDEKSEKLIDKYYSTTMDYIQGRTTALDFD
ncbi:hypothetical protein IT418_01860 [bacterium]|nr:hypothetical protein [bacterium]